MRVVAPATLTYPVALETVLAAEETALALLLTCRALQRAGLVAAVCPLALSLSCLCTHLPLELLGCFCGLRMQVGAVGEICNRESFALSNALPVLFA